MNRWISITAGAILAIIILTLIRLGPPAGGVEHLRQVLLSYGPWAVLVSAGMMVGQAVIAPLPGNVVTITNGLVFGPFWGSLLSWSTMLAASSVCFLLSRLLGRKFTQRIAGTSLEEAERFFRKYGMYAVLIARVMPLVPFDAISFGAGLVGVPYTKFITATGIGIIPSILVYSYVGSVAAAAYWWILITLLSFSFIALVIGSRFFLRKATQATRQTPLLNA
jgi:uncharacterized membrane protein YdjX (TVP38/TMEM64 family)